MKIRNHKKGFTLPELVVTLIVLAVILAIGIPTAIYFIKRAEFRKNEENAKTIYMAAESALTWYRSSGQWEEFREEVLAKGIKNTSFTDEKRKDRIYAITLAPGAYDTDEGKQSPVTELMDDLTYSKDLLSSGAVAIEIDVESGHVYSAFYGTRCKGLGYGTNDEGKILDMDDRGYDSRRERLLGYYSADDTTDVVDLDPVRLKVTSISLVNSETLYLNWSSNSRHDNLDLEFYVVFYEKNSRKELFRLTVNRAKARGNGWSESASDAASITQLQMVVNNKEIEGWNFPLTYKDGAFSLVLDGMMSADVLAALKQTGISEDTMTGLHKSSDMSITRLARIGGIKTTSGVDLSNPQNIYATVQAVSTYQNTEGDTSEYRQSAVVTSNTANTMYADDTKRESGTLKAGIAAFRHLSNIRYCSADQAAEFTLEGEEMDWNSEGTGLYGYTVSNSGAQKLQWKANDGQMGFPAIPELAANHSLDGGLDSSKISNLRLGTDSVADDAATTKFGIDKTKYSGLFCKAEGSISNITFRNPSVVMADISGDSLAETSDFRYIHGVGIVAGLSTGDLTNIKITTDSPDKAVMNVLLPDDRAGLNPTTRTAGVGGIAGIIQGKKDAKISGLSVSGVITAKLPDPGTATAGHTEEMAKNYQYGVGGLFGYADLKTGARITRCENHADVSANLFAGGIAGHVDGSFKADEYNYNDPGAMSNLTECENDGLILCTTGHEDREYKIEGRYFGGVVGYAHQVLVYDASSASGRASGFTYSKEKQELLKGQYVGGIMGFGTDCLLLKCNTENKGYILGSDYVGGIVGGLTQHSNSFSRIGGGIGVTTNAGYVIGRNYVGGIIGKNDGQNKIEDCVNNGVAAGYNAYIGGIVGYNGEKAIISNCASYISDHSGVIFNQIVNTWQATGSYAGGIAGYNNGTINFKNGANGKITVKSVAGIVVGQDYVGGVVGFNDTKANLDVDYVLIGGRIYAYGDCAGGYIGLNASTQILDDDIEIRPTSVRGTYCVGGCIGANVVDLESDTTMDGFRTNNTLGSLTAKAFAGGVIGYQRTYTASQLGLSRGESILSYVQQNKGSLLPQLDGENLPTEVARSGNMRQLILTDKRNSNTTSLSAAINNLPVRAQMYVGGVLGYCEDESRLVIKNCKNAGHISRPAHSEFATSADGVSVVRYLAHSGVASANVDPDIKADMAGGVIGANLTNQVIDHCANTGNITGFTCLGGVVGFNGGGIFNCELAGNFGNASQDYVGGIAGLNIKTSENPLTYKDYRNDEKSYIPGIIAACRVNGRVTVTGRDTVGGIAAYNLPGGVIQDSVCVGNITAYANCAGGISGRNGGTVLAAEDQESGKRTISGRNGQRIGGLVGYNEATGSIQISGSTQVSGNKEVTAVGKGVTVIGGQNVGGLIGENQGTFGTDQGVLVCEAANVRALRGYAGGIAGISSSNIKNAKNASAQVTADTGLAGGIVSHNLAGGEIASCTNVGNVNSNYGYAGGIVAENYGTISDCSVLKVDGGITIRSRHAAQTGAICAVNYAGAVIEESAPGTGVMLDGDGAVYGAVTGLNQGTVKNAELKEMPDIRSSAIGLSVGGAAGVNQARIESITAKENFENFSNYRYLGGIAGENTAKAVVTGSSYAGKMTENGGSTVGNCYGGIVGVNSGNVTECKVEALIMNIKGAYTATGTSTAQQKEAMASHTGGIVGKNEEAGVISDSYLDAAKGRIAVDSGMAGGVAGYNKGMISRCGDQSTVGKMSGYTGSESIDKLCANMKITANTSYVNWEANQSVENLTYNNSGSVSDGKTQMILSTKGSLGGITAYNSPTGALEYCATGDWFLNNKSEDISVGTGGVIGMNESEKDMKYLVNRAFVGRQLRTGTTNRFAGGIIGNQSNSTTEGWTLSHCVNYGTIYGYNSHYSGGIIGQWTGSGGNIEECRNYGSLQTTYKADWVGASAGIVAQLYHAYEGNTYNIISCGNFGSIYGQAGKSTDVAANDSAGILGNVTTYLKSASQAQNFTIQVLDCVNGPGVEIYSGSMASGIVGFFSSDAPNGPNVRNSTGNIKIRIERCRNFAAGLYGVQYMAGIFGDRYGETGAKNTILQDCYSVNINSGGRQDFPVVSFTANINNEKYSKPEFIQGDHNYFFDHLNNASSYQTGLSLAEGKENAGKSNGTIVKSAYAIGDSLRRANSDRVYIMHNLTKNKDFVAYLTDEAKKRNSILGANCYIDSSDGCVYDHEDKKIAKILFEIPNEIPAKDYSNTGRVTSSDSDFYICVREGWRVQEGVMPGTKKLKAPSGVTANLSNGKIQLTVTPADNPDPWAEKGSKCDPFKYEVVISVGGTVVATEYIYSESGSVSIPASAGGAIEVKVRAVSMYDDVEPSDYKAADDITGKTLLPAPDLRAEVVWNGSWYRYEISLNNLEDYKALAGNSWKVEAEVLGGNITLTPDAPTAQVEGNENTQQILVQAKPNGNSDYIESAEVSVPAFMPKSYRPDTPLVSWNPSDSTEPKATPEIAVSGTTLENLNITVSLTHSGRELKTPPIYRVDLIGTWKEGTPEAKENVVFASKDILIAAQSTASASFTDLPEYLSHASDLRVRIWPAEMGLGPVYTYHELDTEEGANYVQMTGIGDDGKPVYKYLYADCLVKRKGGDAQDHGDYYYRYRYLSENPVFTWLSAPILVGVTDGDGGELTPQFDSDGNLQYTFYWDADEVFDENNKYEISLMGIDENDNSVLIDTTDHEPEVGTYEDKAVWMLTVPAEDWNFKNVKLSVTRIGNEENHEIGLTSEASYKVRQRLPRPEQPSISIDSVDELYYTVTWPAIASEAGCAAYQLYAQVYDEGSGDYGIPFAFGNAVNAEGKEEYSQTINLEDYAGEQMRFYLVAQADADSTDYIDSAAGITYDLTVPERIAAPKVTWGSSWTYDRTKPLSIEGFETGNAKDTLTVDLKAENDSIPPGGSAYLMRAYVYETKDAAQAAIQSASAAAGSSAGLTDYLTGYLAVEEGIRPVEMEKFGSDTQYRHTVRGLAAAYAGKWIVFQARISSGSGSVSSRWVTAGAPTQLPYVKLDRPSVQSERIWNQLMAEVSENPDLPAEHVKWSAEQTSFHWDSGKYADVCYVDIIEKAADGTKIPHQYRIHEETLAGGSRAVTVAEWGLDGNGTAKWNKVSRFIPEQGTMTNAEYEALKKQQFTYPLTGYKRQIKQDEKTITEIAGGYQKRVEGSYTKNDVNTYYAFSTEACLMAELQADGTFRYTLFLPDTTAVKDADGYTLPDSKQKYSSQITFRMDVIANEDAANKSPSYVGSEENKVELN
ncbi:type II secretion system protein [Roseburia hominis]